MECRTIPFSFENRRHNETISETLFKFYVAEKDDIKRLEPIDFCYVVIDNKRDTPLTKRLFQRKVKQGVLDLKSFLKLHKLSENNIILNKLNHSKEAHQLYVVNKPTRGVSTDESNNIRTSETEINAEPFATVLYNGDAYSLHCTRYKQYEIWLRERNLERFKTNMESGQQIDGKNMLHAVRLIMMAKEISFYGEYNVKRKTDEVKYLLEIKRGDIDLQELIKEVEDSEERLINYYKKSNLPEDFDFQILTDFEVGLRKTFYNDCEKKIKPYNTYTHIINGNLNMHE